VHGTGKEQARGRRAPGPTRAVRTVMRAFRPLWPPGFASRRCSLMPGSRRRDSSIVVVGSLWTWDLCGQRCHLAARVTSSDLCGTHPGADHPRWPFVATPPHDPAPESLSSTDPSVLLTDFGRHWPGGPARPQQLL